jgi:phage terminase small subunit
MATKRKQRSDSVTGALETHRTARDVLVPNINLTTPEEEMFLDLAAMLPASERTKPATAALLGFMAQDVLMMKACDEDIAKHGIITESHGQRYPNPSTRVKNDCFKRFLAAYSKLAMSPSQEKAELHRQVREEQSVRGNQLRIVKPNTEKAPDWAAMLKKKEGK